MRYEVKAITMRTPYQSQGDTHFFGAVVYTNPVATSKPQAQAYFAEGVIMSDIADPEAVDNGQPHEEIDNITIFSGCVSEFLDTLWKAFPLPARLSPSNVSEELYAHLKEGTTARVITSDEPDYEEYISYAVSAHQFQYGHPPLSSVAIADYAANSPFTRGEPYVYWTREQRLRMDRYCKLVPKTTKICEATLQFLVREGCIADVTPKDAKSTSTRVYTLTARGFSCLNKKFEGTTIHDTLVEDGLKNVLNVVNTGANLAEQTKRLVQAVASFCGYFGATG